MIKRLKTLAFALFLLTISSCKKESTDIGNSGNPPTSCNEAPFRIGTKYVYAGATASSANVTVTTTSDTTIAGIKHFVMQGVSGTVSAKTYAAVDASGNVWQWYPVASDVPATHMIYVKTGEPVNTSWSYSYNSISSPTMIKHKYTYTILSKSETFVLNGVTYTNGIKVRQDYDIELTGISMGSTELTSTWFCGLGNVITTQGGTTVRKLTSYTY